LSGGQHRATISGILPSEDNTLSKLKSGQDSALELGISLRNAYDGEPVVAFVPSRDFVPPHSHSERLEWIRKSYERFLAKLLEKEELVGPPPTDIR
jgi:hypothetical protein